MKWWVPEVIQSSDTDCGPASVASFLAGFGLRVSYAQLREACYTDLDGTSIDDLEDVARRFGLDASQTMVPPEHLACGEAGVLPAIAVLALPGGVAHFVVLWRRVGAWLQVMDPMVGRRWMHERDLREVLYRHHTSVPAELWRAWAGTDAFLGPLRWRLRRMGVARRAVDLLVGEAQQDESWRGLATLEALVRLVESAAERGRRPRREAAGLLASFAGRLAEQSWVPERFFSAWGPPEASELTMTGAVLVTATERTDEPREPGPAAKSSEARFTPAGGERGGKHEPREPGPAAKSSEARFTPAAASGGNRIASPDEGGALAGRPEGTGFWSERGACERGGTHEAPEVPPEAARPSVLHQILAHLRQDGALAPSALGAAAGLAGATAALEALLFKGVLEVGGLLFTPGQRTGAVLAVAAFVAGVLLFELRLASGVRALGRRLEARLRVHFLHKLVRLPDSYFAQRLTSDLTLRVHSVVQLRGVPVVAQSILRTLASLLATVAAMIWLDRGCAPLALLALGAAVGLPLLLQSRLAELQLSLTTYQGGLSRYLLDALLGVLPLKSHVAQPGLLAEHDRLLARWARARRALVRSQVLVDAAIYGAGTLISGLVLHGHLQRTADTSSALLLVFWASQLPALGRTLARSLAEYPARRAVAARILEPLQTPDEESAGERPAPREGGARLLLHEVSLDMGRTRLLDQVELELEPGCHCAVLGASGAGKSSLLGLLLGWHRASAGVVALDGRSLEQYDRDALSAELAWIDPQVQLWNRSLYDNLTYGAPALPEDLAEILELSGLRPSLDKLPQGLATPLGEGGSALSQGEAQRVRVARAMLRRHARLVLLDEPLRGLDRPSRARLLKRLRRWWSSATLLCVTHDVHETLDFDRVLVLEQGRVVESGLPAMLARQPGSAYARMLESERQVRSFFDESPLWTRWVVREGRLARHAPSARRADEAV
jgi:ABC-type bacteriocin/lantibiotic exporter with double-glycine peptidase domain